MNIVHFWSNKQVKIYFIKHVLKLSIINVLKLTILNVNLS